MPSSGWLSRLLHSPRWEEVVFWALDLETSGLEVRSDRILQVALVPIRHGTIRYGERYASLVRPPGLQELSTEGIRAHHILPADLEHAPPVAQVLPEVDRRLREGALVLHYRRLDLAFLRAAYRREGRDWPRPKVVDTVDLLLRMNQKAQMFRPHATPTRTALSEARAGLGLPAYPSHDALSDALATAELFLLLRAKLNLCTLRSLLH